MPELDNVPINWFAKRYVSRLWIQNSTIWDAIELMNDLNIRHIPIVEGMNILGIINPSTILRGLSNYTDNSTFDLPLSNFMSDEFIEIDQSTPVLDVIDYITTDNQRAAIMTDDFMIEGIFTHYDLITQDYFWNGIHDSVIDVDSVLGIAIDEFNCVPQGSSILEAIRTMQVMNTEVVGVIDSTSKILTSTLDFIDLIHYLNRYSTIHDYSWDGVFNTSVGTVFPSTGLYVKAPVTLSDLRSRLISNEIYHTILLDDNSTPRRIISSKDIAQSYVTHY